VKSRNAAHSPGFHANRRAAQGHAAAVVSHRGGGLGLGTTALKRDFYDDSCVDSVLPSPILAVCAIAAPTGPSRKARIFLILGLSFPFRIGVFAPLVRWCAGCALGPERRDRLWLSGEAGADSSFVGCLGRSILSGLHSSDPQKAGVAHKPRPREVRLVARNFSGIASQASDLVVPRFCVQTRELRVLREPLKHCPAARHGFVRTYLSQ
jgi:hypothetical protein